MRLSDLISFCKRRGLIFQSSDIYGGLNGFWDYGPVGVEIKRNLKEIWWQDMVGTHNDLVAPPGAPEPFAMTGLDTAIIMHPRVWQNSGHYDLFHDMMIDCRETKMRYRYDQVRGRWVEAKGTCIFVTIAGDVDDEMDAATKRALKFFQLSNKLAHVLVWHGDFVGLDRLGGEFSQVLAPAAKSLGTLTEPREFNLMLKTHAGPVADDSTAVFLRPETAQGIFVNFKNVLDSTRFRLPLGIAQIGKSFRNEITPRHFIFRSREFEQMEMEFFCHPSQSEAWYRYWRDRRMRWYAELGMRKENLRLREHGAAELSHYSRGTADVEYAYPFLPEGEFGELEGIAHRGDFDLRSHMEGKLDPRTNPLRVEVDESGKPRWRGSGKNLSYRDDRTNETFVPHVIEPAAGVDRMLLAFLCDAYTVDQVPDEHGTPQERIVLRLHPRIAPFKAAVLPLIKKEGMPEIARDIYGALVRKFRVLYDEKDAIGRRYRRVDEIGVPICITVDGQTLEDGTVTFRDRDSLKQWREKIEDCETALARVLETPLRPEGVAPATRAPELAG
ncbi:MAG TPA: glycine--tRNA ligase [Alphaproteobacteria bacterium]|nr:glycine--tRNA ligase [Alphaproteobacteria bacterium]